MAAKKIELIKLKIDLEGLKDFKALTREIAKLDKSTKKAPGAFKSLAQSIKEVTQFTPKTISQFRQKEKVLKKLREEVRINGIGFKRLGNAIEENRKKLQAFNNTAVKPRKGGLFSGLGAGGAAAIGGAGAYIGSSLGLPPAISGLASAGAAASAASGSSMLAGGLAGAGIGAGITAVAGGARFGIQAASYAAEIQKLQIALKGVTKDQKSFTKGLDVINKTSKRLNVPIAVSTRQFTTLSASVLGAGGTIEDAEEVFTGVSNAIKATGGSADDVQSAIRAMSQIFGKGKVSAEELQGQLGERLAGAVVKFAEANGSTLQKLQKDLRDGTVGLDQIMKFVVRLNEDFADTATKVSDSSADAGQRLKTTMDRLKLAVGSILQPIGAEFQKVFGNIVGAIADAIEAFNEFMGIGLGNAIKKTEKAIENLNTRIAAAEERGNDKLARKLRTQLSQKTTRLGTLTEGLGEGGGNTESNLPNATTPPSDKAINQYLLTLGEITKKEFESRNLKSESLKIMEDLKAANIDLELSQDQIIEKLRQSKDATFSFKEEMKKVAESAIDLGANMGELAVSAVNRLADGFAELAVSGKANFGDLARSILADLQKMIIKALLFQTIFSPLKNLLNLGDGGVVDGGEVTPSAKGNVFAKNKIVPYAYGGIVNKPTLFPMANGMGLMGEAGPEAIMPLKRGRGGRLGVEASGGTSNIVVNVDASGSSVQGDDEQAKQLGQLIGMAVQSEIVEQQRPGGLLA